MMIKQKIIFFALLIAVFLMISSCDRQGDIYPNAEPVIYITSYGGVDSLAAVSDSIIFQQNIYWEAYDADGWVEAYAYRILNKEGQAISTPGHDYIIDDKNGNGITDEDEGWVLHYEAGADEDIPLNDPQAKSTIWTEAVHAKINFPANGEQLFDPVSGDPVIDPQTGNFVYAPVTSIFEIKCLDDRGDESQIFRRYFKSNSKTPSILSIESTQGPIDEKRIGTGVVLKFRIADTDPLIGNAPNYFLFKLQIKDTDGNVIPESQGGYPDGPENGFFSTKFQEEVTEFLLIPQAAAGEDDPGPFIITNTPDPANENVFLDSTYLTVIAYDLAGIPSQPKTIRFAVKDGFYPGTIIYNGFTPGGGENPSQSYNDIFALGKYHYTTKLQGDLVTTIDIPEEVTLEGFRYGLPFWVDKDQQFTAINSPNLKIYMHWGYQGEYGKIGQESNEVTNSPYNQRIGEVLDENTQEIYFSELKYFDLQLDGEPYHYPPLAGQVETVLVDSFGYFTRIPVGEDIAQRTILFDLESGDHVFRVRAVDLSNIGDPTPAEMHFTLVDPVMPENKEGILIIDEDPNNAIFSPDVILDSLYFEFLADYAGTIDTYDLWDNSTSSAEIANWNSLIHFDADQFSPVDLQNYKLVIYCNDKNNSSTRFHRNYDCFNTFFELGGNLMAILGDNTYNAYDNCNLNAFDLMQANFGIPIKRLVSDPALLQKISGSYFTNPFMIGAAPVAPYSNQLDLELDEGQVWNTLLANAQGLGPCTFFKEDLFEANIDYPTIIPPVPIYRYISKEVSTEPNHPSQEQYDLYNDQVIAIKHDNGLNTNYLLGFSLTVMEIDDVKAFFNEVFTDLGM